VEQGAFDQRRVLGPDDHIELPGVDLRWLVADLVR